MLGLPIKTELNKQLAKKIIYTKFQMNTATKEKFDADISKIAIVNEVSCATTIIEKGEDISSFFVLLVVLKKKDFDEKNIAMLSKLIPQNILFVLQYEDKCRLAVYQTKLIENQWQNIDDCKIALQGDNFDKVWENVIVQIGNINIENGNTLTQQIEIDEQRKKLEKEIAKLEKLARTEKQPKKKFELVQRIKNLQLEMEKTN